MRTLTQYEVESVSGGMSWGDIWGAVKHWLDGLFGQNGKDATGALNNAVNGCTSHGGTANYTVNGSSYSVGTDAGGSTAGDDGVLGIHLNAGVDTSGATWHLDCSGATGGGNGRDRGINPDL